MGDGRTTHLGHTRPIDNVRDKSQFVPDLPEFARGTTDKRGNGRISLTSGPDALCDPGQIRL
jgi:hypothetical protein